MFDLTNTRDYQVEGTGIYLLESIPGHHRGGRNPSTRNKFSIRVDGDTRSTTQEERDALTRKICDLLNAEKRP